MSESVDGFTFDLNDFRRQIGRLRTMGAFRDLLGRIPEVGGSFWAMYADLDIEEEIRRMEGIIDAMTPAERRAPRIIDAPRRRRIADGAGVHPAEVACLVEQFDAMAAMARQMASTSMLDKVRALTGLGQPVAFAADPDPATGERPTPEGRPRRRREARSPVEVRFLRADQELPPLERATLRRLWEILARNGRTPSGQEPWFSNWNRNLRLWDFCDD